MEWPPEIKEYAKAQRSTPFFCRVVECLSTDPHLCALTWAESSTIQVALLKTGDVIVRFMGNHGACEMPNWPHHDGGTEIVIAGGYCPGAQTH